MLCSKRKFIRVNQGARKDLYGEFKAWLKQEYKDGTPTSEDWKKIMDDDKSHQYDAITTDEIDSMDVYSLPEFSDDLETEVLACGGRSNTDESEVAPTPAGLLLFQ